MVNAAGMIHENNDGNKDGTQKKDPALCHLHPYWPLFYYLKKC